MEKIPERILRDCLYNWLGFGNLDGSLWFIGFEESIALSKCSRVIDWRQYFDLRRGFALSEDFVEVWDDVFGRTVAEGEAGLSTRWFSSIFSLAYEGVSLSDMPTAKRRDKVREYTYLDPRSGRLDGDTFIGEVFPLPKSDADSIEPYSHVWPSIDAYRDEVLPQRIEIFQRELERGLGPECVVSYTRPEFFADPILERYDFKKVATWPGTRDDEKFRGFWLRDPGVLVIDAPFFGKGHAGYQTLQRAAEGAARTVQEYRSG